MKRRFWGLIAMMVLVCTTVLLSGCGSSVTSGTWYMEGEDDTYINFLKDGIAHVYDSTFDSVYVAEWTEKNGTVKLKYDSETLKLKLDGKDTLTSDGFDVTFEKGRYKDVPAFTLSELLDNSWVQDEYELDFYGDDTWDIYDSDEIEYTATGTYKLEGGKLTMTDDADNDIEYIPTLSADRTTLTMSKDMVFELEQ